MFKEFKDFEGLQPKVIGKVGAVGNELVTADFLSVYNPVIKKPNGDEIWYKTSDGNMLTVYVDKAKTISGESVTILSHELKDGWYVIKFSNVVGKFEGNDLENGFIHGNYNLKNLYLSNAVVDVEEYAFNDKNSEMDSVWCNNVEYKGGWSIDVVLANGDTKHLFFNAS